MNFAKLLSFFLTTTHLGRFVFVILSLWQFYINDHLAFFITYIVIFGLIYILQIIVMANGVLNTILSIFSLQFIKIPFVVDKPKHRHRIVYFLCIEVINSAVSGYFAAYFCIQNRIIPLWVSIPHLVLSCLDVPIFYEGILFNHLLIMKVSRYFIILIEFFLTVAFTSVLLTLPNFWIVFCVGCWRLTILFEPYAFWCSLHSVVSPFRGMSQCIYARSLIAVYLLYIETFLLIYVTAWFMEKTVLNQVFTYIYAAYYLIYLIITICDYNLPFTHKIKPIQLATKEEPSFFDPTVL